MVQTWIAIIVGLIIGIVSCAIPGFIAKRRRHTKEDAIFWLGMLGGLTTFGILWIVALIWALMEDNRGKVVGSLEDYKRMRRPTPQMQTLKPLDKKAQELEDRAASLID
jgi:hypothetical protein